MYEIALASGKKIELTANTQLFTLHNGKTLWKKSCEFRHGEYVATPRKLFPGKIRKQATIDLVQSNPVIHNVKPLVNEIVKKLVKKYGNARQAAKKLGITEGQLYYNWVNESARGNIKLKSLKKIAEDVKITWKKNIKKVSIYNGKTHTIPPFLTKDTLYVAGLIAGDGDISQNNTSISVRLSSSCPELHTIYRKVLDKEFQLHYDIQKGSSARPEATRANAKILGEILIALGIPTSPKSDKIHMSNTLLHLSNHLLKQYIAGLYDTDGSIYVRPPGKRGSDCIDLTTCSETLARQVQLALLRFNICTQIRKRPPSTGKIKGKKNKWVVEIHAAKDLQKFRKEIPLQHPKKKKKLSELHVKASNTNIDIIPGSGGRIKKILQAQKIPLKKVGWHKNLSRSALQTLISAIYLEDEDLKELKTMAESDIFWDKITRIQKKASAYEYVYDLTVNNSHNFIVDGILVHNTASVVRDEFMRGYALEAGALVLANNGICCIDELDKMTKEDRSAMHEALEQQQVTIAKANIQATLRCVTTVIAAANPKWGRFDPYELLAKQIDLPSTLINRFDLIFPIRDLPNPENDSKMASFILNIHQDENVILPDLSTDVIKKYISYAKQTCKPQLTTGALEEIKRYYVEMRGKGSEEGEGIKAIPISARQLEALIRLSEASAKTRLSNKVTKKDAKRAIDLVHYCLSQIGLDPQTGKIDIDRIATGIPATDRSNIQIIRELITELEDRHGKAIPIEDLMKAAKEKGLSDDKVDEVLEKLKRAGDIFTPKSGVISKI